MRVVHVYKGYPPEIGGIELTIERMARWLVRRGHEVTVIASAVKPRTYEEHIDGVRVVRVAEYGRALSTPFCPGMARQLARVPADVHHLHFPNPTGELSWLATGTNTPMVMTYHGDVVRQEAWMNLYGPIVHRVLRRAAVIMPSSQASLDRSPLLVRHRDRCRVVPLGIDLEPFLAGADRAADIAALRAKYPGPLVVFVGRLVPYKGVSVLLEAMRSIPATLLVVGEGPCRGDLERQRAALGLGDRVVFTGQVPEVVSYMAAADVGVLPSVMRNENWGLAMLEMMACGVPVVCTELGTGTSTVNRDGVSGLVVPPNQPEALAGAVRRLLEDDELRRRLGAGARERAVREFSVDTMMQRVFEFYEQAVQLRVSGAA
jgi:glycosyltransferase involved in cell wall biosynthesis